MLGRLLALMALPVIGYASSIDYPAVKSNRAAGGIMLDIACGAPGKRLVAVGERGHILYSDNQGNSWQQAHVPTRLMLTAVSFPTETVGYAVGHEAVILKTEDAGKHWVRQHSSQTLGAVLLDVWFGNAQQGIAVGAYGMALETDDGGKSWRSISRRIPNPDELHLNGIYQHQENTLFLVGEKGILFRSDDLGASWRALKSPYNGSWFGIQSTSDNQLLVYGLRGNIFQSGDLGESWSALRLTESTVFGSSVNNMGGAVFAGDSGTLLWRKKNQWFEYQYPDRNTLNDVCMTTDQHWIIVGESGIKRIKPDFKPVSK